MSTYRVGYGYAHQTDLQRALDERGYAITTSAINKYESGHRSPPPEFIVELGKALELGQEDVQTLAMAAASDKAEAYMMEYIAQKEKLQGA